MEKREPFYKVETPTGAAIMEHCIEVSLKTKN